MIHAIAPRVEDLIARERLFREAIQPIVNAKVQLRACCLPRYILVPGGGLTLLSSGLTPDMEKIDARLDEMIAHIATHFK